MGFRHEGWTSIDMGVGGDTHTRRGRGPFSENLACVNHEPPHGGRRQSVREGQGQRTVAKKARWTTRDLRAGLFATPTKLGK